MTKGRKCAAGQPTQLCGLVLRDQVRTLRELGCDFAQGYFFAKPVPAEELPAVIARVPAWRQIVSDAVVAGDQTIAAASAGRAGSRAG